MAQPFVGVHFPKAGGSSLSVQLSEHLADRVEYDYGHDPLGPAAFETAGRLPPGRTGVYGHFRPERYAQVPDVLRFTFLREPVDNLISIYFFWQTRPEQPNRPVLSRFLRERPSIEAFAAYEPMRRLLSETYFGGYDVSRFDFIGFHDSRAGDVEQLGRMLGLPLVPAVKVNVTVHGASEREALRSDPARLRALQDLLVDDIRFYERLRSRR